MNQLNQQNLYKIKNIFILSFVLMSFYINAQQNIIGEVKDDDGFPIESASVFLYQPKDSVNIVTYALTDDKGVFKLTLPENKSYYLHFSALGYEDKKLLIRENLNTYKIRLKKSIIALKAIEVVATVLKDTISLKRDTIKFAENATLKDILKDNEGIEITEDDGIKYMGVPINKILINKKEVFVNQNSVALNNVTNEMINNIQVINNYRDKFKVDFNNFDEMVLNVNVKSRFRGAIKGEIDLYGGYKNAFETTLKSMYFSDKLNGFFVQNTNTINARKMTSNALKHTVSKTSNFFSENLTSVVKGKKDVEKDFYNNSYLLLKNERENLKSNLNIGYVYGKQRSAKNIDIKDKENLLSREISNNNQKGNLFFADIGGTYLISKGFSVYLNSNADLLCNALTWDTYKTVFPNNKYNNYTDIKDHSFVMNHSLGIKKLLSKKWLLGIESNYTYEDSQKDFINRVPLQQKSKFLNRNWNITSDLFYQRSLLFNLGLKASYGDVKQNLNSLINVTSENTLKRNYQYASTHLIARGRNPKMDYFINIGEHFFLLKDKNKWYIPVSASFNYKITSKKSIHFSYEKSNTLEPLENTLPLYLSNNTTQIIGSGFRDNLSQHHNAIVSYNIANMARSKSISFLLAGSLQKDFTQLALKDFSGNMFTYERLLFKKKKALLFRQSYQKGYYFSSKNHEFTWHYSWSLRYTQGDVFHQNKWSDLITKGGGLNISLELTLQEFFLSNIYLQNNFSLENSYIEGNEISPFTTNRTSLFMDKTKGEHTFSWEMFYQTFQTLKQKAHRLDIDIDYRYKINDRLSFLVSGKSLISLISPRFNRANISTDINSGFNITTTNNNILGYFITGFNFKF